MTLPYIGAGFQPAEHLLPVARVAEECGFAGLTLPDHVAYPAAIETDYPGTADGSIPWSLDRTPWVDPLVGLTAVAAATDHLRLMTHVFVLPLRAPVLAAKTVGTIAALFPGRFELGIGVGWLPDEFTLTGTDFTTRGGRTEESVEILRALWGEQPASYQGKHHAFADIGMFPVPTVPVPLLLGGTSEAALERATRIGDGYVAMPATIDEYEHTWLPAIRAGLERNGRDASGFHLNVVPSDIRGPEDLHRLHALDITSVQLHPFDRATATDGSLDEKLTAIGDFAARMEITKEG
jgi:probable F420-dependent oxidoreductase